MGFREELKENVCRMRFWILALIVVMSLPMAYADCPDQAIGRYPGWAERFSGEVSLAGNATAENFNVVVEKIFTSDAIQVNILRDNSQYSRETLMSGADEALKKSDILVELDSASVNSANLTVYTPQRANITANLTNIDLLNIEGDKISLLPGEVFQIDFQINNTGELEATDVHITPQFGDFELINTNAIDMNSLCQGSTQEFKYTLKAPDLRAAFNYSLYLHLGYNDNNIETGEANHRSTYHTFEVEIAPSLLGISRSSGNWTLKNPGRDIPVRVTLNNSGSEDAYNVEWSADLPPYVQVSQGTTSFTGRILEGKTKTFNYDMVSDDPLICNEISSATYQDRYGNDYSVSSSGDGNETFRFSPFITVEKSINKFSWNYDPVKSQFQGTTTFEIEEDRWWDAGTYSETGERITELSLDRTKNLSVSVKIKNIGNAVARGLVVEDIYGGGRLNGANSWMGDLAPGAEATYEYILDSLNQGNISMTTTVKYSDVDPSSFKPSIEDLEGEPQIRYCTVTTKDIEFENKVRIFIPVPSLNLSQSTVKVLGASEFIFNVTVLNNGSDSMRDVITRIDTKDLSTGVKYGGEILRGQSLYYLQELKAEYFSNGTSRTWTPTNVTYRLVLRAPDVEADDTFTITTEVNYTDFYGEVHTKNISTNITVVRALPAYEVLTLERKNLTVTSSGPGEIDIDGYGDASIKMKNTGFADLENITLRLKVLPGIELYSNDTAWHGRVVAELKRNDTWYGFEGEVEWNGSLGSGEEMTLPFLIRGRKAGLYDITASLKFNDHNITGSIPVKVKGAILEITKSIGDPLITADGSTEITITVRNIGEASAEFIKIIDHVPPDFDIIGETGKEVEELKSGEETTLVYTLIPQKIGSYTIQKAELEWTDALGNEYAIKSSALAVEVIETPEGEEPPAVEEEGVELSRKQTIATAAFALVFLFVMFKFLTLSKPIQKE
jgi:hypothetical protein